MSQQEARFTIRSLFVTAAGTVIATVVLLHLSGRLDHGIGTPDHVAIGDFTAVHVNPGEEFRMSPRASGLHGTCENGFLAVASDTDPVFRGILVDYRKRGVRCQPATSE